MNKLYVILSLAIVLSITGCKLFFTAIGAYKSPEKETPSSIMKYMDQSKDYDGLFMLKKDSLLKYLLDSIGSSIPNIYIFNSKGQNIYSSKNCV